MIYFISAFLIAYNCQISFADHGEPEFTGQQAMQMPGLTEFRASLLDCVNQANSKCLENKSKQDLEFASLITSKEDDWNCKIAPISQRTSTKEFSICIFRPANKELKARFIHVLQTKNPSDFQADHPKYEKYPRVFIFHESGLRGIFTKSDKGWKLQAFGMF